ncbi:MAG: hypothetical protein M0Q13_14140 [Methanothrix sp.]|jgi:hypothetical protein|nr:hypothetical protein [Methanothrix sp.]
MEIEIGTKFIRRTSKRRDIETVTDILTTYNSKDEIVAIRYVATHKFMGQLVTNSDIVKTTILRSEIIN